MTALIRVAFIGAGRIAGLHALAYRDAPDAELYAVCDADAGRAAEAAAGWGAPRSCTDYREVLADPRVDAVDIITPHHLHREMAVAALDAGKHVSLQKPVARTLAETDEILAAASRSRTVFRVFENYRYYPPFVRARQMLQAGEIGDPVSMRIKVIDGDPKYGWDVPIASWAWRLSGELAGGGPVIFDHGYHIFSLAMWLFGPVQEVFAWIERTEAGPGIAVDAPALIAWKHGQAGPLGSWETLLVPKMVVRSQYYSNDEWLEITGTRGVIWVTRCTGQMLDLPPLVLYRDGEMRTFDDMETDWAASFVASTRDWLRAIRRGGQPELSGEDAREVLRFSLAAHRSAREGRPVRLADVG